MKCIFILRHDQLAALTDLYCEPPYQTHDRFIYTTYKSYFALYLSRRIKTPKLICTEFNQILRMNISRGCTGGFLQNLYVLL
ncbi:hypothetical protein L1987_76605 [Smallanthus sonchifolius]|uniref:Uncharacterized protein n=1 Tax=Smallanthus sonchifolius TaxID=185202 RepID=A0ACB8Z7W7_9ASTR|nr:hypothetical protein L1987_76605 [Smallanthus sonchifolius]